MQGLHAKSVIQILQEIEISLFDYFKMVELILTADKKECPGFDKLVLEAEKAMKEKNNTQRKEDKQARQDKTKQDKTSQVRQIHRQTDKQEKAKRSRDSD